MYIFRVVFHEVLQTNKDYMRDLTVIEPSWLYELAPHYYQYGTVSSQQKINVGKSSTFEMLVLHPSHTEKHLLGHALVVHEGLLTFEPLKMDSVILSSWGPCASFRLLSS